MATRQTAHIRAARRGDLDRLEALENAAFSGNRLSRRSLRAYIASEAARFLVLELDGLIVGDAILATRRGSRRARLYSIAIASDQVGRGLGRQLLAACERVALERGCAALRLEVRADNAAAIRFYEAAGYVRFGRYDDYYEDGEAAVRYERALAPLPGGATP